MFGDIVLALMGGASLALAYFAIKYTYAGLKYVLGKVFSLGSSKKA